MLEIELHPYFVMGVALPDLWPRFSRSRRIRWKSVIAATPDDERTQRLQAGLLNHVEADRRFHVSPAFLQWQHAVKAALPPSDVHHAAIDFLAHVAVELALDQALVRAAPALAYEFYEAVEACDLADVERRVSELGDVDSRGLALQIQRFAARRFLLQYATRDGLVDVIRRIFRRARLRGAPDSSLVSIAVESAVQRVSPQQVWEQLLDPAWRL